MGKGKIKPNTCIVTCTSIGLEIKFNVLEKFDFHTAFTV